MKDEDKRSTDKKIREFTEPVLTTFGFTITLTICSGLIISGKYSDVISLWWGVTGCGDGSLMSAHKYFLRPVISFSLIAFVESTVTCNRFASCRM